jgi:transposase-like protein
MIERGIQVDHSTIMRWVHQYSPEIEKKIRRHLRPTNDSWRVDETYINLNLTEFINLQSIFFGKTHRIDI